MFNELSPAIRLAIRPAIVLLIGFTLLLGLVYPLAMTGIANLALPAEAGGSLVTAGGKVIGSALIGQDFVGAGYFQPRPSAAGKGFDASASSGSNLAPGSKDLAARITTSIKALRDAGVTGALPADLLTTSASGLDPDISPAAAIVQAPRIGHARGVPAAQVVALVERQTSKPLLGILGEARVNVLAINRELDRTLVPKVARSGA
jgi:K+-transporting ATPase ATPase C chain